MSHLKKEDARVLKTKASLMSAFKVLVNTMSYEDVTINDLCTKAEIRRATFYKHFNDKQDFLKFVIAEFWSKVRSEQLGSAKNSVEAFKGYTKSVVDYLHNNERLVNNVLHSPTGSILPSLFVQQCYEETKRQLELRENKSAKLSISIDTAASIISGGMTTAILTWYDGGMQSESDDLIKEIGLAVASLFNNST